MNFRMLPQALKMTVRSASPLLRFVERWTDNISVSTSQQVKTLDQMPGPSAAGFIWDLFFKQGLSRLHQLQLEGRRQYGPMWKASFGPILTVHVAEPELIEQVLRQEGQHPMRSDLSSWKDYRQLRGHGYGLLTAEGEEWQNVRSLLAKHMLRPKAVEAYDGTLNAVVTDLINKLKLRKRENSSGLITDIAAEFYCFGLEGISSVLFESRIGCLEPVIPMETEYFIQSINTMFVMTLLTMAMPAWLHRLVPKPWDKFCHCWDYMFQFGRVKKSSIAVHTSLNDAVTELLSTTNILARSFTVECFTNLCLETCFESKKLAWKTGRYVPAKVICQAVCLVVKLIIICIFQYPWI